MVGISEPFYFESLLRRELREKCESLTFALIWASPHFFEMCQHEVLLARLNIAFGVGRDIETATARICCCEARRMIIRKSLPEDFSSRGRICVARSFPWLGPENKEGDGADPHTIPHVLPPIVKRKCSQEPRVVGN